MQKNKSILYTVTVLLLITAIVATIIAFVNDITYEKRLKLTEEKTKSAIASIFPNCEKATVVEYPNEDINVLYEISTENGGRAYCVDVSVNGYGGEINMMVGFFGNANDGITVNAVKIVSADSETPGLGARVKEAEFLEQFSGKNGGGVDAVAGATISSTAVVSGVDIAYNALVDYLGK